MLTPTRAIVADSLGKTFPLTPAVSFREVGSHLVDSDGRHIGARLLKEFENPEFGRKKVIECRNALDDGRTLRRLLAHSAGDINLPMIEVLRTWREMFTALYSGALDEVIPFNDAIARIAILTGCSQQAPELLDLLTPTDGRNILSRRDHAILLHLAYQFGRRAGGPYAFTYENYDSEWLASNFIPLSYNEAYNNDRELIPKALTATKLAIGIRDESDSQQCFEMVRESLKTLHDEHLFVITRCLRAREKLLYNVPTEARIASFSLMEVLSEALQMNEEIHHELCLASNSLRFAAQTRSMSFVPLSLAFAPNL